MLQIIACGKSNLISILCFRIHFKEYLVSLVNREGIDPVSIMDVKELKMQLERLEKHSPKKQKKEKDDDYRARLMDVRMSK